MRSHPAHRKDVIGLYSGFWTRFLLWVMRTFPDRFCLLITPPIALVFYCLARQQRNAVYANLRALHPEQNAIALWWSGWRVFTQFSLTYMDRLWSLHLGRQLQWRTENVEHLSRQLASPQGLILFTTHSGNYDIGALLFEQTFSRDIHIVRVPEETTSLQELRASELKDVEEKHPHIHVLYAGSEWSFGLKLCEILRDGGVVAVQGDRPLSAASLLTSCEGITFNLPRGPFILARMSRVPCYPISLRRVGCCTYSLVSGPAFFDGVTRQSEEEIAKAWLSWLIPILKQHWNDWFVFEPIVQKNQPTPATAAGECKRCA